MTFKFRFSKYLYELAGNGGIGFSGWEFPVRVHKRVLPFIYESLGVFWVGPHEDIGEKVQKWEQSNNRKKNAV